MWFAVAARRGLAAGTGARGVVLFPFLLLVPMLILLVGWLEDMARVTDARGKAIAAADAASLAGALTADAVIEQETSAFYEEGGGLAEETAVAGCRIVMNAEEAEAAAVTTLVLNPSYVGGAWRNWTCRKAGDDRFSCRVEGSVGLPWWGWAKLLLGAGREHSRMAVSYEAEARAVCVLPPSGSDGGGGFGGGG
jgi:hypothetical protein